MTKDPAKAAEWYQKAAEQGYAQAQNRLGECYFYGQGKPENKFAAVKWYEKAAEQGIANAQYSLGYCYEKGYGVTKDKEQAMQWYKKAADQGHESAKEAIDGMESGGLGSAVAASAALGGAALLWKILRG